jgi:hypothetical protein
VECVTSVVCSPLGPTPSGEGRTLQMSEVVNGMIRLFGCSVVRFVSSGRGQEAVWLQACLAVGVIYPEPMTYRASTATNAVQLVPGLHHILLRSSQALNRAYPITLSSPGNPNISFGVQSRFAVHVRMCMYKTEGKGPMWMPIGLQSCAFRLLPHPLLSRGVSTLHVHESTPQGVQTSLEWYPEGRPLWMVGPSGRVG